MDSMSAIGANSPSKCDDALTEEDFHVVIIGAGMAGLTCARELLLSKHRELRITVLEATSVPGGRIRSCCPCPGVEIDLGAEFVHGYGTILTDLIDDLFDDGSPSSKEQEFMKEKYYSPSSLYEPVFAVSHADGGPDDTPTPMGMYGMYYVDGALRSYDDPLVQNLRKVLDDIMEPSRNTEDCASDVHSVYDDMASVGEALDFATSHLPVQVRALANASYANTAGCSDLYSLSLAVLRHFEQSWFRNESAGDFRLRRRTMKSVVDALVARLDHEERFQLLCNWKVLRIRQWNKHTMNSGQLNSQSVRIESASGTVIHADAVVVTVPPPMIAKLDMELSPKKQEALTFIGFERAVKVILLFSSPSWPHNLQGMVCGDGLPIPEIWFLQCHTSDAFSEVHNDPAFSSGVMHVAVGYLMSKAADVFILDLQQAEVDQQLESKVTGSSPGVSTMPSRNSAAANIFIQQLALVLNVPAASLQSSCLDCLVFDWKLDHDAVQGGYMHGKKGMRLRHFQDLAEAQDAVFFAGEATNTQACCTIQAAMETGSRAAKEVVRLWHES